MKEERKATSAANATSIKSDEQLNAVLAHQKTVTAAEDEIRKLEQLSGAKRTEIDQTNSEVPNLDNLNRAREDLLAAVAAGDATEGELQQFDQESEVKRAAAKTAATQSAQKVRTLEQAISGLERRLDLERRNLDQLNNLASLSLRELLRAETVGAAESYLQAAANLEKAFLQIVALDRIMSDTGLGKSTISNYQKNKLYVPVLSADGFEECSKYPSRPDLLMSGEELNANGSIESAVQAERQRLQEAGVSGI